MKFALAIPVLGLALAASLAAQAELRAIAGPSAPLPISAAPGQDRVAITLSLISYPGVPERSSCRFLFRAVNQSGQTVGLSTLLHTFDSYQADLNSWLVPTGDMAPGQMVERLYSCKSAVSLRIDQRSDSGWPKTCTVDGRAVTPCPVAVDISSNLKILN